MSRSRSGFGALVRSRKVRGGLVILLALVLISMFGPLVTSAFGLNPSRIDPSVAHMAPSFAHPLGTNSLGQDVLAQLLIGGRGSLLVGLVTAVLATSIAIAVGATAGFFGGRVDHILTFITNVFLVLPTAALIFVIAGYVRNLDSITIALLIGLLSWAGSARAIRAQTMTLAHREWVNAASSLGENRIRLLVRETLPHELGLLAAVFLQAIVAGILAESGLRFLGIGDVNEVTWGGMIGRAGSTAIFAGEWWWFVPPGVLIGLVGVAVATINFGIDEVANPALRLGARRIPGRSAARKVRA